MCLIALALDSHPRFPLVIAANRDEFLQRPAAALAWWPAAANCEALLGGRDLQAGGTWMALNARGRIAMLTNVRDPLRQDAAAASRGAIVPAWLNTDQAAHRFWPAIAARGHNPFNLLAGDMSQGQWWWADDRAREPQPLGPGLYGLSNTALDTPWPKVLGLKSAMADALDGAASPSELETLLFAALSDRSAVPDDALPDTGIGRDRERWLAPAFIRTPDARYGTPCSTLLIVERRGEAQSARLVERQFDGAGHAISQNGVHFERWPLAGAEGPPVQAEAFSAS